MKQAIVRNIFTGGGCGGWLDPICQALLTRIPEATEARDAREIEDDFAPSRLNYGENIKNYLTKENKRNHLLGSHLSIGDPDYRPIAFLERALRLSASVCRIVRRFSFKDLAPLIKKWNSQDAPEMCKALEFFFEISPEETSWAKYWEKYKGKKFEDIFETPKMKSVVTKRNEEFLFVPYATGFLVGKSHVITNFHALNKPDHERILDDFRVQFRYERNLNNRDIRPTEYKFKSILSGDLRLDYTLSEIENFPDVNLDPSEQVSLSEEDLRRAKLRKEKLSFEQAGENFGWLRMNSRQPVIPNISCTQIEEAENELDQLNYDDKVLLEKSRLRGGIQGEPAIIIQHPRGRAKEIVAFNSHILKASDSYIQYTTDTDFGSSGSPILNGDLQLIGLHFGALVEYQAEQEQPREIEPEDISRSQRSKRNITIKANIGTRISAIVRHLREIETDENASEITKQKVHDFIGEYIDSQLLVKRRIFLLGGLEQNIPGEAAFTKKLVEAMSRKINEMSQSPENNTKCQQVRIIDILGDIRLFSPALNSDENMEQFRETPILENQRIAFNKLRILSDPQLPLKMAIAWMNTVCDN
jgi:hypothetical protein